jgi:predicted DCC family thiol-disulfide oxidoreductase YuxK
MTPESNAEITADPSPMLVYDGSCGFCSHSVQFLLRHERRHDLSFVTRNSELGKEQRRIHGFESLESMLWIEDGQAFAESDSVMKAADYLGGWWCRLAVLGSFCPSFILNGVYRFIAKKPS